MVKKLGNNQTPEVQNRRLYPVDTNSGQSTPIIVDSQAWYRWLGEHKKFIFRGTEGHFTARCERIRGAEYWYAYRRRHKKLHKIYLGKTDSLTLNRLQAVSAKLAGRSQTSKQSQQPNAAESVGQVRQPERWFDNRFLLATKLRSPTMPANIVRRPRLTNRLRTMLTVIAAPAGFGKTTLISEWLQQREGPVAWVSLDAEDNNLAHFWTYIIAALQTVHPNLGQQALTQLHAPNPIPINKIATLLVNEIEQINDSTGEIILVLDDYHLIETQAVHDSVMFLLNHVPARLRIVIASQAELPFSLGRLRAKRQVTELEANDLRLTPAEATDFFEKEGLLLLNPQEIEVLVERTDGWITGLYLVALALQGQDNIQDFIATFDGHHRYLSQYFIEEVLQRQPQAIQTFLLYTSILENLNESLCNAVTGQTDSHLLLAQLRQANLFLIALDDSQGWYRYHQLFSQALRQQLETQFPEQVTTLHRRAAHWYGEHGVLTKQVRHLLAARAWEEAAGVIEQIALTLLSQGEVQQMIKWLQQLPEQIIQKRRALVLTYARLLLLALQQEALDNWLNRIETTIGAKPAAEQTLDEKEVLREVAQIRGIVTTLTGKSSVELTWSGMLWESLDAYMLGLAHWTTGNLEAVMNVLAHAVSVSRAGGNLYMTLVSSGSLAHFYIIQGRLNQGAAIAQQALHFAGQSGPLTPATSPILLALGQVLYEQNRLEEALASLTQGIEIERQASGGMGTEILISSYVLLARTQAALGNVTAAYKTMNLAANLVPQAQLWTLRQFRAYQARLWLVNGEFDLAKQWLIQTGLHSEDEPTRMHELEYWVYVEMLIVQGEYGLAERLLNRLLDVCPTGLRTEPVIRLLLPQSLALFGQGKVRQAIRVLKNVLRSIEGEGYIRPFLGLDPNMIILLTLVKQTETLSKSATQYVDNLLDALHQKYKTIPQIDKQELETLSLAATISHREQELLQLVSAGLSNKEIARKLVITVNTVKTHLRNIYRKLEVNNRAQAVTRAKEFKLF